MDVPASGDDVLAQPTRARLFGLLSELRRPAGTAELAERLGLHPNGVRLHLERMRDAGLVERSRPPRPRGRPRDSWSIAPGASPGGRAPSGYADLGRWLARSIPAGPRRLREVESAGRSIGRELAPEGGGSSQEVLLTVLSALGFDPRMDAERDGAISICLRNCPYRDAVRENQEVVCTLHRGLTRGLLDALAPRAKLTAFVPRDPYEAGCQIELTLPEAAGAPGLV